jgi:hypothetical protein
VKTTLSAAALLLALGLTAVAAKSKSPPYHGTALGSRPSRFRSPGTIPTRTTFSAQSVFCSTVAISIWPSLNAAGLSDENTLLILGGGSPYARHGG